MLNDLLKINTTLREAILPERSYLMATIQHTL